MSLLQQCYALTCYTVITTYDIWAQARHTLQETTLSGKIICAPARHSPYKATYQIWSLQLKQFWRYVRSYTENCRGHVT